MDSRSDFFIGDAAAQARPPPRLGAEPVSALLLPVMLIVVFYFLLIRPQQKTKRAQRWSRRSASDGDRHGRRRARQVTEVGEQFVTVEIADGVNIKVQRHSISAVLPKDTIKSLTVRVTAYEPLSAVEKSAIFGVVVCDDHRPAELLRRRRGDPGFAQDGVAVDEPALEQVARRSRQRRRVPSADSKASRRSSVETRRSGAARDVLTKALPNHVVALTLAPRTPSWLKGSGSSPCCSASIFAAACTSSTRSISTRP